MKISELRLNGYGPFQKEFTLHLVDSWTGQPYDRVLLSGPNGCGKSTIIRFLADVWHDFGSSLSVGGMKQLTHGHSFSIKYQDVLGESVLIETRLEQDISKEIALIELTPKFEQYSSQEKFQKERKKLLLNQPSNCPNIVYLDSKRQWINPDSDNIGATFEDSIDRWLPMYKPSEEWKTQLELSMINLKLIDEDRFNKVVDDINTFFDGKQIEKQMFYEDQGRLRITISGSEAHHTLDELSSGEQQVIIMIYMISRYMQSGGVVLIDEPDLFLHPSLVDGMLSRIEAIVEQRNGQLIIASHNPDIWSRYESLGLRVRLGEDGNE